MKLEAVRIGLVTFGAGKAEIRAAARRVARQGRKSGRFSLISLNTDITLRRDHQEFCEKHKDMLHVDVRGFGYWIWKPYLINYMLRTWQGNVDFLLYLDSGCEINYSKESERRWQDYLDLMKNDTGRLVMQQQYVEKHWQKMDVVKTLGLSQEALESGQILGGVLALRADEGNIRLTQEWLDLCTSNNYHLVDDTPSRIPNESYFVEHRHDQSILSALIKRDGATIIPVETYWSPNWIESGSKFPIWTAGNKTGISFADRSLLARARWLARRVKNKALGTR